MREQAMAEIDAALNDESTEEDIADQPTGEHPALPPVPESTPVPSDATPKPEDEKPVYQNILTGAKTRIEQLPTPGSIVFPLLLLLVTFLILIPINGKTRMQWLWEVLTGNAQLVESARKVHTGGESIVPPYVVSTHPAINTTIVNSQPAFSTTALLSTRLSHVQELI